MRDPRIEPRPGDIVRVKEARERHVASRPTDNRVVYIAVQSTGGARRAAHCRIETWQKWCRRNKATVVQVA